MILLDEPFTHLDHEFVEGLELLIKQLRDEQNKTIIFTTHNKSQAQSLSDQVFSIEGSRLVNT